MQRKVRHEPGELPWCQKTQTCLKSLVFHDSLPDPIPYENPTRNCNIGRSESVSFWIRPARDVLVSVGHGPIGRRIQEARKKAKNQSAGPDLLDDPFKVLVRVKIEAPCRQAGDGTEVEPAAVQRLLEEAFKEETSYPKRPVYRSEILHLVRGMNE